MNLNKNFRSAGLLEPSLQKCVRLRVVFIDGSLEGASVLRTQKVLVAWRKRRTTAREKNACACMRRKWKLRKGAASCGVWRQLRHLARDGMACGRQVAPTTAIAMTPAQLPEARPVLVMRMLRSV